MKCATTWLAECLREHPQILMSLPKETHFFSTNWEKGEAWYRSCFRNYGDEEAVGEFSVDYLYTAESLQRIVGCFPDGVRIVICLRNPVDRTVSHIKHYMRSGRLPIAKGRLLTRAYLDEAVRARPEVIRYSLYARPVESYIRAFGEDRVLVLLKDEIDEDPGAVLERAYRFLGVRADFVPRATTRSISSGMIPRFPVLEKIRRRIYRPLKKKVPDVRSLVRSLGLHSLYTRLNRDRRSCGPLLPDHLRGRLVEEFRADVESLEGVLGRDLSAWKH